MRLYKVKILHGAPKDHHLAIQEYFIAKTEEDAFNYVDEKHANWTHYFEPECDGEWETLEEMKAEVLENKGDLDSEWGWEDAYYGVTKWGWEEVCDINDKEIEVLLKLGVLK